MSNKKKKMNTTTKKKIRTRGDLNSSPIYLVILHHAFSSFASKLIKPRIDR